MFLLQDIKMSFRNPINIQLFSRPVSLVGPGMHIMTPDIYSDLRSPKI